MNSNYSRSDKTYTHREKVETALGRRLSGLEVVHHVNYNKKDNRNSNLVVCPNDAYHKLLHQRTNALDKCGDAHYRKCQFCGQYDAPESLVASRKIIYHRACAAKYKREKLAGMIAVDPIGYKMRVMRNRRISRSKQITAYGESKSAFEWFEDNRCVVDVRTLRRRILAGWNTENALSTISRLSRNLSSSADPPPEPTDRGAGQS